MAIRNTFIVMSIITFFVIFGIYKITSSVKEGYSNNSNSTNSSNNNNNNSFVENLVLQQGENIKDIQMQLSDMSHNIITLQSQMEQLAQAQTEYANQVTGQGATEEDDTTESFMNYKYFRKISDDVKKTIWSG